MRIILVSIRVNLLFFVAGIILCGNMSYSQEKPFQLIGRVKGSDTGLIKVNFLLTDTTKKRSYTTKINKGQFFIQGKIAHPMRGYLVFNSSMISEDFFVEAGKQYIYFDATTKKSFYQSIKITGSAVNDEFIDNYQRLMKPFYDNLDNCYDILDSLNKLFPNEKPASVYSEPCRGFEVAIRKIDSVKKAYIIKHSYSYISLWTLYTSIWSIDNLEFVAETFKYLDNKIKNSVVGKWLAKRLEVQSVFLNERKFPSMRLVDSNEKKIITPEIIKGKYTLIDFWFSHCGPCIVQFPSLLSLYSKYKELGFDVIAISIDKKDNKKDWLETIAKHKLSWRQFWDVDGKETNSFFIDSFPTNFLLDRNGTIIKKNILLEELDSFLMNNLK